jgi:hypothetical protein
MGHCVFAVHLPETTQAHSGTQIQGFGLLVARYGEGLLATPLYFHHISAGVLLPQQEFSPDPLQFRFPPALSPALDSSERLCHDP